MSRLNQFIAARQWSPATVDLLVGVGFLAIALPLTVLLAARGVGAHVRHVDVWTYALTVFAGLGLVRRRGWPWVSFTVTLLANLVYTARGYPGGPVFLPLALTVYALAVAEPRRRSLLAGVVAVVGDVAALAVFRDQSWLGKSVITAPIPVAAILFLGWAVSGRRGQAEEKARRRVDAERLRIARELHDVVAHSIATINVQAGVALHVIDKQPEHAAEALQAIKEASRDALREMRGILGLLRQADDLAARAPAPGLEQLDALVSMTSAAGLETRIEVEGEPRRLPALVDLAAYRIVQESLTNALRYAGPASARVSLVYGSDHLAIEIRDNGNAAAAKTTAGQEQGTGHGIVGMRERATAVGGRLDAGPGTDGGFCVRASLPFLDHA